MTERAEKQDIIIKAAAVADYRPATVADQKMKKSEDAMSLSLERTTDILSYLGQRKTSGQFLCGFSMETENVLGNSRAKLEKKNLDMIAANSLRQEGAGFAGDTNILTLITQNGQRELELMSKKQAAMELLTEILKQQRK